MANEAELKSAISISRRKEDLLAQGALLRSGLSSAQNVVRVRLRPESLVQSAISHVAMALYAAFKSRTSLAGVGLPTLLPLLIGGVSALSKKALLKPALRVGLVLATVGAIIGMMAKRKKTADIKRDKENCC
jgi:hypothetical protein